MNIALTGANGSIGRELRPFLKHQGHNVFSISTSAPSDGKLSFTYEELIGKTINVKIDIFLHLASINSNLKEEEINKEIKLTKDMLLSLPALNCKKLIFFSSAKVYGDNSTSKVFYSEDDDLNPRCAYGKAKKLSEELIQHKSSSMGIKSIILRLPPVLCKSTNSNLGKLIQFSQRKIPLPIFAQGFKNQRSILSLNNLKTIINYAIQNNESFFNNEIYNASDSEFISISELLNAAGNSKIFFIPENFSKLFFKLPLIKTMLLKLYGNFVLDNSKLQSILDVKLKTTYQSLKLDR